MPLSVIKPNSHLKIGYFVPKKRRIEYEVEASLPVTTFVLDDAGLIEYNKKRSDVYSYYGGFSHRYLHQQKVTFTPLNFEIGQPWYLIIQNDSDKEYVAVRYEVFE